MNPSRTTGLVGTLLCIAAAGLSALPAAARSADRDGRTPLRLVRAKTSQMAPGDVVEVELDRAAYRRMARGLRVVVRDFPLPAADRVDLDLERFEVLTPDARLVQVDASGERNAPRPQVRSFRGRVRGDPESLATVHLFGERLAGFVRTGGAEYVIVPDSFDPDPSGAGGIRVRRREADPDRPDRPFCAADDLERPAPRAVVAADAPAAAASIESDTLLEAAVAIDATYQWYQHFGSLAAAENYILSLMADVSAIYVNEVDVEIVVPYLRVFTTAADPYTDTTDTSTLLDDLRSEWNDHQTGIDRTVVHLFSRRPSGGAGIAYLDVLCNHAFRPGRSYDYGVSTLSANGASWEKELVAHELGHNFSSPHTHCYVPEIDRCANQSGCYQGPVESTVGTIMSYCSSVDPVFHPRVEDERIRPAAEAAYPTCIDLAASGQVPLPPEIVAVE